MVYKIRLLILFIICIILCLIGITNKKQIETNLMRTLLPVNVTNYSDIIAIADKSSSVIKVVFEADNQSDLEELKQNFNQKIDKNYFESTNPNISKLLEQYLAQSTNFLSPKTKKLLINKKYDKVYENSLKNLYNPAIIQLNTFDKDPYLLLDDFIMSNIKNHNEINFAGNKYYDCADYRIKNNEALSLSLSNQKIRQLISIQKQLSNKYSKIYLAGTPIHSYYTSTRCTNDINIICLLSIIMIIFLTHKYFRNLKLLLPITLSITFGLLSGYVATKLWFDSFQIITMVFSSTLIGIGIDYSYHYFFAGEINRKFIKNLSFSLLTTIIPFALLYMTGIDLLKQIAIFIIFGLTGIYFAVVYIYPCFKISAPIETYKPNRNLYKICLILLCVLSFAGIFHFSFNDNLTALYNPSKTLAKAEMLYKKISGENTNIQIITVKSQNKDKIVLTEENVTKDLDNEGIDYISLSKIFPSEETQKENFNLIKKLYENNLNKYSQILSAKQINDLKNTKFVPVRFDTSDLEEFMLDKNTSMIIVFGDKKINIKNKNAHIINFQSDITQYIRHYRHVLLILFPVVIIMLFALLTCLYDGKRAIKLLTAPICGVAVSILLTSLLYEEINLFSIITIFLVLGFTIDYSIFRNNAEEKTESAIFVSCITTCFSFLMLTFCGFKLLSSMSCVLFWGILTSYLTGYLLFNKNDNNPTDSDKWFNIKEHSAGKNRLRISWFLYKIFGKNVLYLIAFFVAGFTFIFAQDIRKYSKEYFEIIKNYTNLKPNLINQFKHILSYANSLVDKMLVLSGNFNQNQIVYDNESDKKLLFSDIQKGHGVFFICNHIGNIEIMQAFLCNTQTEPDFNINIFMSNKQSQIFNNFLQSVKVDFPVTIFNVEDIGLNTGIELKENLNNGDAVFIAGDRLSQNNDSRVITEELFSRTIKLPQGTYKLAELMDVPTYFISAIKIHTQYKIFLKKQENLTEKELAASFAAFLEKGIKINPFQFFHFYKFFE